MWELSKLIQLLALAGVIAIFIYIVRNFDYS